MNAPQKKSGSASRRPRQRCAFVTGANGFLGVHVVQALQSAGWRVVALHREDSETVSLEPLDCERVTADILDFKALRAVAPARPDAIVHCASNTSLWRRSGPEQLRVNVRGTRNVVRLAEGIGARRLLHVSCAVSYGQHSGVIQHDTPRCGKSSSIPFVRSKAMAEIEVERGLHRGLDTVILNPAFMLGAHDRSNWSRLVRLVAQRRLPGVPGGGGSFVGVDAVARAIVVAIDRAAPGSRWILGGVSTTYASLAREIGRQLGHRRLLRPIAPGILSAYARLEETIAPVFGRDPDVTREAVTLLTGNTYCDAQRARRELDLETEPVEVLVKRCIDWMRAEKVL